MTPRFCPLPEVGCIEVHGRDAQSFLHAQLSREIATLEPDRAPLAGWHDARGRLRALFRVLRVDDGWLLVAPSSLISATVDRLRMFVLHSNVTLIASTRWTVGAFVSTDDWLDAHGVSRNLERDAVVRQGDTFWVRLGPELVHVVGAGDAIERGPVQIDAGSSDGARAAEIRLGLPTITPELVERFIPQMLNLDLLDAVSFDKGCYPGQEVITRVHNLGSVKRRMRRYTAATENAPAPLTELFAESDQPVGEVIRCARTNTGIDFLAVVEHSAAGAPLFLRTGERVFVTEQPLPYEVPKR